MRPLRHGRWAMERVTARNRRKYLLQKSIEKGVSYEKMLAQDAVWWEVVLGKYVANQYDDWDEWWSAKKLKHRRQNNKFRLQKRKHFIFLN